MCLGKLSPLLTPKNQNASWRMQPEHMGKGQGAGKGEWEG